MKISIYIIIILLAACQWKQAAIDEKSVKVIFDTDMGPDFDDAGAIAVLHALAAKGECEILACGASDSHPLIAPTIALYNHYFSKPDIPVGKAVEGSPDFTANNHWNDSILARFPFDRKNEYPDAVQVYRKALSDQPDKSVVIITVGFLNNLELLLKSPADEYSPLSGIELVKQKVSRWVAMAASFPEGKEYNINMAPQASQYVLENWPTPMLFSGFEIGEPIMTGKVVADHGSETNPVAWAYAYNLRTFGSHPLENRNSWDLTAVLCAIRDPEQYFYLSGPGRLIIEEDGYNYWKPEANAQSHFLVHKYPYQHIANILDELMSYEPPSSKFSNLSRSEKSKGSN